MTGALGCCSKRRAVYVYLMLLSIGGFPPLTLSNNPAVDRGPSALTRLGLVRTVCTDYGAAVVGLSVDPANGSRMLDELMGQLASRFRCVGRRGGRLPSRSGCGPVRSRPGLWRPVPPRCRR